MAEIKVSTVLDLIKNKNQTGFELLYTHHYKLLFSTAFTITKNEEDSKDVVQNVVYKLAKMPASKFPETGQISWLYSVVKNEAINFMKSVKQHEHLDESIEIPVLDKDLNELFDMEHYYSLIESLNENQKKVVTLKVLGELSHKEISMILNKPIGTVQWIYNTSIKQLRISLATMASFIFVLAVGVGARGYNLYRNIIQIDPNVGSHPGGFDNPTILDPSLSNEVNLLGELVKDNLFMFLTISIIVLLIGMIAFLKFSDKIPTKQTNSIV